MLNGFKSKPAPSESRTVPYGGLGGCVEVKGGYAKFENIVAYNPTRNQVKRKPSPIEIHNQNGMQNVRSSPKQRLNTPLPAMPKTPMNAFEFPMILKDDQTTQGPSAYQMWEKCEGNPWFATIPAQNITTEIPGSRQSKMPAELPGSLLLPSQGFPQILQPSTPRKLPRTESDSAIITPVPSLTHSNRSSPDLRSEVKIESNSEFAKEVMESLPPSSNSSSSKIVLMQSTSIEQLLHILCDLTVDEILNNWMSKAENELVKFRTFITNFDAHVSGEVLTLRLYYEEIQAAYRCATKICESHNEEFRNAQISTSLEHESDLIKVMRVHYRLAGLASFLSLSNRNMMAQSVKLEEVRQAIKLSIKVLSGFIRNQMTFQLHQMCGGISERKIKLLQDFDRGSYEKQRPRCSPDTVTPNTTSPKLDSPVRQATLKMLMKDLKDFEYGDQDHCVPILQAEKMNMVKPRPELQYIVTKQPASEDIIDSYLYSPSIYSTDEFGENNGEKCDTSNYQERISELNRQVHQILRATTPSSTSISILPPQQSEVNHQPCPNRTPPPPPPEVPTRLRPPLSPENTSTPSSTTISPLTPPPKYQLPVQPSPTSVQITPIGFDTSTSSQHQQQHQNLQLQSALAARDSTITNLRQMISSLEAQNELLKQQYQTLNNQTQIRVPQQPEKRAANAKIMLSLPPLRTGHISMSSRIGNGGSSDSSNVVNNNATASSRITGMATTTAAAPAPGEVRARTSAGPETFLRSRYVLQRRKASFDTYGGHGHRYGHGNNNQNGLRMVARA